MDSDAASAFSQPLQSVYYLTVSFANGNKGAPTLWIGNKKGVGVALFNQFASPPPLPVSLALPWAYL